MARGELAHDDPDVRATALAALVRMGRAVAADVDAAVGDPDARVRRRLAEVLPDAATGLDAAPLLTATVLTLLADADDTVAETACWAAGELWEAPDLDPDEPDDVDPDEPDADDVEPDPGAGAGGRGADEPARCPDAVLDRLIGHATGHDDSLVREAAVAALGSIGDERGLPAILSACTDKATVRRRAVLALAPFDGPEVEAALDRALTDRDWQVRQAAEDLQP